jgi:hypothetical protein
MIPDISPEAFEALEGKHGELYEARTGQGVVLFRCPTEDEWHLFEKGAADDEKGNSRPIAEIREATTKLVFRCIVHPDREAVQALLKKRPAMLGVIARYVGEVAKGSEETRAKKPEPPSIVLETTSPSPRKH